MTSRGKKNKRKMLEKTRKIGEKSRTYYTRRCVRRVLVTLQFSLVHGIGHTRLCATFFSERDGQSVGQMTWGSTR